MQRLTNTFKHIAASGDRYSRSIWLLLLPLITVGSAIILPPQSAMIVQAQSNKSQGLSIKADTQEANSKSEIVTAKGNVRIYYPSRKVQAKANIAQYYIKQKRIILTGDVLIVQDGNTIEGESVIYLIDRGIFTANPKVKQQVRTNYILTQQGGKELSIQANSQEANTKAETFTANGNVRLSYPDRKLQARANVAQYNAKEQQIVLSGNVLVIQDGSSLQGDTITYLIDEGRFVAKQKPGIQVQSIYVIPETTSKN